MRAAADPEMLADLRRRGNIFSQGRIAAGPPRIAPLALAGFVLAGCGPIPVAQAEAVCADRFAVPPPLSVTAKAGLTSNGETATDFEVEFAPSVSFGDPSGAYNACVMRKSGEYPTRPLYQRGNAP